MSLRAPPPTGADDYLAGRRAAWFAFAMTFALMLVDFIDRQVIVSLLPYIKTEWGLSDKQLGGLVSVVSVTVALGALPIALIADRTSRVKSIVSWPRCGASRRSRACSRATTACSSRRARSSGSARPATVRSAPR